MFLSNFIHRLSVAIAQGLAVGPLDAKTQQKYSENIQLAIYASLIVAVPIITIWLSYSLLTLAIQLVWLNLAIKFGDQFLKQLSTSMAIHSKTDTPLHLKLYNIASDLLQNATVPTILLASYLVGIPLLYIAGCSFLSYHLGLGNRKVALEIICAVDDIVTSLLLNTSNLVLVLFPQFRIEIVAEYFHRYLQASKSVFEDAQIYIDRAICTAKGCIIAFKQQETNSKDCSPEVTTTASTDETDDLISRGVTSGVKTVMRLLRTVAARSSAMSSSASTTAAEAEDEKHSTRAGNG